MWDIIKQAERQTKQNGEEAILVWTAPSSHAQTYSGSKYLFYHTVPGLLYTPSHCNNVIATPEIIAMQAHEWQACHKGQTKDTGIAFCISRMCWSRARCLQLQSPLLKVYSGTEKIKGIVARMVKSRMQLLCDTSLWEEWLNRLGLFHLSMGGWCGSLKTCIKPQLVWYREWSSAVSSGVNSSTYEIKLVMASSKLTEKHTSSHRRSG